MFHCAVRTIQAYVRHVLAAAKIKKSKGLSKFHAMIMGVGMGGQGGYGPLF